MLSSEYAFRSMLRAFFACSNSFMVEVRFDISSYNVKSVNNKWIVAVGCVSNDQPGMFPSPNFCTGRGGAMM